MRRAGWWGWCAACASRTSCGRATDMEIHKSGKVYDFMSIRKYWIAFSIIG